MNLIIPVATLGCLICASVTPLVTAQAKPLVSVSTTNQETAKLNSTVVRTIGKKTDDAGLSALLENPAFLRNLIQWKLSTQLSQKSFSGLGNGIGKLRSDLAWQEALLNSGPMANGDLALEYLAKLYKEDSGIGKNPLYKKMATGIALEFARRFDPKTPIEKQAWTPEKMLKIYEYFRDSHRQGLLSHYFDKLDYWEMRLVLGNRADGWYDINSLTWQRDNVRLPAQDYTGACWQAPYRLNNSWGESIHGPEYYNPFTEVIAGNAERTKVIGGVCGGLSTFGATAALANGIPAMTMGEPGHCAYAVRINEKEWVPSYSLSWQRGTHWNFYGHQWAHLILMQKNFEDQPKLVKASRLTWMAEAEAESGNNAAAETIYQAAIEAQPTNYATWLSYLDWTIKNNKTKENLQKVSRQLCATLCPEYPEIAWETLSSKIYPVLMPLLTSMPDKLAELDSFHKSLSALGPAQWNFPSALQKQLELLGNNDDALKALIPTVVNTHLKSKDYSAPTLTWCQEKSSVSDSINKSFHETIAKHAGTGDMDNKALEALVSGIIKGAEETGNMDAFQSAGKLAKSLYKDRKLPDFEPFPGELLSSGGILNLSSVSGAYDQPWKHWGVLEPCGGHFHTNSDDPAWATVTLPRIGDISGIVVVGPEISFHGRCNNTIIEVSVDGQTWEEVGKIENVQHVNRIDLSSKNPRAKKVRFRREGREFYHFQALLIYGKKAS